MFPELWHQYFVFSNFHPEKLTRRLSVLNRCCQLTAAVAVALVMLQASPLTLSSFYVVKESVKALTVSMGYMTEMDAIPAHPPAMMSLAATVAMSPFTDDILCTDRRNKGVEHK